MYVVIIQLSGGPILGGQREVVCCSGLQTADYIYRRVIIQNNVVCPGRRLHAI